MGRALILLVALIAACAFSGAAGAGGKPDLGWFDGDLGQTLHVRGMTFVASEASSNEIVLHAEVARFYPDRQLADLEQVHVEVASGPNRVGFEMRCDKGQLNLSTQDFIAEGHVVGTIEGGREFEALWVAYDEEKGVLYTDAPVLIVDQDGRYRGGGFRYVVRERRFRLEGGASVVQGP
ncbi:MAG: LPS export ABC transporter periplasmic protein LptC [Myxococcota bacterium]